MKAYYVYILTSHTGTLHIGVTNDLERRVWQHKQGEVAGFTSKYGVDKLVYYEQTPNVRAAIEREKQLKGWKRQRKLELNKSRNPKWQDLSDGWYS